MPRSIEEGFDDFLVKLKAKAPETDAAKRHRASIEACLISNFGLQRFVRMGSFGNGTSVSGFSDIDYLASIPTAKLTQSSTYSLSKIRDALDARFPRTGVNVNTPAVAVPFGTYRSETTEVVPADYVGETNGYKVYEIADGGGGWMRISPDSHNDYVARVDQRLGGRVKPLIRFIKAWKFYRKVPISSFYLEMRVAKYAEGETAIVSDIDVSRVLRSLWDQQLAKLQDPTGFSGYVPACKTDVQREDALSKLSTAVVRAQKARQASRDGDISTAFSWWRLLYDDAFPTYYR
ncbi:MULTISPECIES: nucleotidyltransferase [unclassified Variovorax]|uniref:SMODS domain-containing nucleotidyltransferase n=1 Tax=unclassified Variovorax TaxID=663243 RepID=UPI0032E6690E